MRSKTVALWATLSLFSAAVLVGCDTSGTSPQAVKVPPVPFGDVNKDMPKDVKKGGGPASSGNMKVSPADST
jgi:hypothetical protein